MLWEQQIRYAALSDVGFRRQNNQDACVVVLANDAQAFQQRGHLFIVADGMGGHAAGELASKMAVDTIPLTFDKLRQLPPAEALKTAIITANEAIHQRGTQNTDFLRMGTTCSTLLLCPQGAIIGHVGDSRVYRIRDRHIDQLTSDHSLVWELIQQRKVHPRDAERMCPRNIITRSLGPEETVQVDVEGPTHVMPGDTFVLCSDGLCGLLSDSEIGMIAGTLPPTEATRLLVHLSNLRGGPDNITVIVAKTGEAPADAQALEAVDEEEAGSAWWWIFVMYCALAVMFMLGLGFYALDPARQTAGIALIATSVVLAPIWPLIRYIRNRRAVQVPRPHVPSDSQSTIIWRPYRTAPAKVTEEFIQRLGRMEGELQRAASEERWQIDWKDYDEAYHRATEAVKQRRFGKALAEYGRIFDLLMVGVHDQRRQLHHESRWGKGSSPNTKTRDDEEGTPRKD